MTEQSAPRAVGRPRDPAIDAAILAAVRELLVDRGYHGLAVQAVAVKAGVHAPAIARRWRSKAELVGAAVFDGDIPVPQATGNLAQDLREVVSITLRLLSDPAVRAAVPALLSEKYSDPSLSTGLDERASEFEQRLRAVVLAAIESGDAPASAEHQVGMLVAVLVGTSMSLEIVNRTTVDDALIDGLTQICIAALRDKEHQ